MLIKRIFLGTMLLLVLAMGWRYRNSEFAQNLIHPKEVRPVVIEFDNGSVRQNSAASEPVQASGVQPSPPGTMRKCQKGAAVIYTDNYCPPGMQESGLSRGTVTVVHGQTPAKSPPPAEPSAHRSSLNDVLDRSDEQSIADKRMERVIGR
jgi:hypothetical protein